MIDLQKLKLKIQCLTVFRGLLADPVLKSFLQVAEALDTERGEGEGMMKAAAAKAAQGCAALAAALYQADADDLGLYIKTLVLSDENPYVRGACTRDLSKSPMDSSLFRDLAALSELASVTPSHIREAAAARFSSLNPEELFFTSWSSTPCDLQAIYRERLSQLPQRGYGIFAKYHTFVISSDGQIVPVKFPDPQALSQLTDYERERQQVISNTKALIAGEPASNVLLYGDAGTGKSSTIKAVANEYRDQGLRLIEVKKNQLYQIPDLMETISANPLKFILFIDDLSFATNDSDFAALKAILEGSVAGKSGNLAVYATSNRRHLIKETLADRQGDDIHLNDTMQELMSLSARFGLVITYEKPNKDVYLNIVNHLAAAYGVDRDQETLFQNAEAFAIRNGGRSPRVAKQFIELVRTGIR